MTQPIPKRADQLVLGDRILNVHLPAYARSGDADVLYVEVYHYFAADWVFVAFASRDGDRNSTSYPPDGTIKVHSRPPVGHGYSPADTGRPDFVDGPCEDPDCPNASWPHFASSDLADPDPTGLGYSPADDGEVTQPIAGRAPAEVAGGLVEVDPPEGFVPASAPVNEVDDSLSGDGFTVYVPCQPLGCDNGYHLPGCVYASRDA